MVTEHQGDLCELPHYCPNCEAKDGECMDLFMHWKCGLVACWTETFDEISEEKQCIVMQIRNGVTTYM